jgi:hypothetical protein
MPRFEKGSQAAKEWGQKMREAKMKKMKGGMMGDDSDDELAGLTANMTMKDDDKPSTRPSALPKEFKKPVIKRRSPPLPVFEAPSKPVGKRPAETQIKKEEGKGIKKTVKGKNVGGFLGSFSAMQTDEEEAEQQRIERLEQLENALEINTERYNQATQDLIDNIDGDNIATRVTRNYYWSNIQQIEHDIARLNDREPPPTFQYPPPVRREFLDMLGPRRPTSRRPVRPRNFLGNKNLPRGTGIKKSKNIVMGGYLQPGEIPSAAGPEQDDEIDGSGMTGGNISSLEAFAIGFGGLFGMAGLLKLSTIIQNLIDRQRQIAPDIEMGTPPTTPELSPSSSSSSIYEISPSSSTSSIREAEETGRGMLRKCGNEMSAEGIGKMFKKASKTFDKAGKKMNTGMAKLGTAVNPMTYALGNKKISKLMRQSGQLTNDYLLPAAVSAGLPLYYGAAGTAGMMLGGPLGALAATKAADTLWQEAVVKRGYDPRERQKSKILGAIAEKIGQAGASQYKAGMSSGKEKKITGGNLLVDMPERAFIELIEMLRISELVNLLNSLASPEAARRRQMVQRRIDRLRSQSPPAKAIIPSGASGKGMKKKLIIED